MYNFARLVFLIMVILNLDIKFSNAECDDPQTLVFSIIPTEESIQEVTIYKPVFKYLERMTGKKIEFYVPVLYENVIQGMADKWIDVAILGPYSYVIANEKNSDIQVFATYIKKARHIQDYGAGYKSILITRKNSVFSSIESLKGAVLGLTDPSSTSGNLIPKAVFSNLIDAPLDKYFSSIIYTGGHDLSAISVFGGGIDAAFVATHRLDNVIDRGIVKKEDFQYLWSSQVIPQDPLCYRNSLCPELKKKILDTFLTLHTQLSCSEFLTNINSSKFVEMESDDYDIIRELIDKIK